MNTFETEWRARFERFARTHADEPGISGWSESGLSRRRDLFRALLEWLELPSPARVLDVGCGAGTYVRLLAGLGHRVVGVDYSRPTLARARGADPGDKGRYVAGEAYALPFGAATFDVVVCIGVLQALGRPEAALDEMVRVLRPGGILIVEALNRRALAARAARAAAVRRGAPPRVRTYHPRDVRAWLGRRDLHLLRQAGIYLPPRRAPRLVRLLDAGPVARATQSWPTVADMVAHGFLFVARREGAGPGRAVRWSSAVHQQGGVGVGAVDGERGGNGSPRIRLLVLSSVYPNAKQPLHGVFVRERVARVAEHFEVRVVAPVAWFPLNRLFRGAERSGAPRFELQDTIPVHHPRVLSVPGILKGLDGIFYFLSVLPVLWWIRRRFPFDAIDAHFAYPDGLAAWLLGKVFGLPVTVTLRGTILPLSRYRLRRIQMRWTLRGVARVFAVSQSLKDVAVSLGVPAGKVRVIRNGVDGEAFRPRSREVARKALGLPLERRIVLSVGALTLRKGHQRVLEALPSLVAKFPDLLYIVAGGPSVEGNTGPLLERRCRELGLERHVRLVGPRAHEEVPDWLAAADVFCLATSHEGIANVFLEALACGLPVVTTRVGGNAEVIREGSNGVLVPSGDAEGLRRALLEALETTWDRAAIAAGARERGWERAATEVVEEFRRLVGSGSAV